MSATAEVRSPNGSGSDHVGGALAAIDANDDYITRMARDPLIDAAKLSTLVDVRIKVRAEERLEEAERRRIAFWEAFPAMQVELPIIGRDANNEQTRSRYARFETIWELCCPVWTKHGFVVTFDVVSLDNGLMHISLRLSRGGHTEVYTAPDTPPDNMGPKGTPNKTIVQGNQSSITYVKRGLLCNALGIVTRYEDDDGQSGTRDDPRTQSAAHRTPASDRRSEADDQRRAKEAANKPPMSWPNKYFQLLSQAPTQQAFMITLEAALPSAPSAGHTMALTQLLVPLMEKAPREVRNKVRKLFEARMAEFGGEEPKSDKKSDTTSDAPPTEDELWAEDVISTVTAIGTRSAYEAYAKTGEVQKRMQTFSTKNRPLFLKIDRAFQNKWADLSGAPE